MRIISATHRDLEQEVSEGRFREDLLFRLMVFKLELPPLRNRVPDMHAIARAIVKRIHDKPTEISSELMAAMERYPWPGNIRELENELKRMLVLAEGGGELNLALLSEKIRNYESEKKNPLPVIQRGGLKAAVEAYEKELVESTLAACDYNKSKTADVLGLSRRYFLTKLKTLGID